MRNKSSPIADLTVTQAAALVASIEPIGQEIASIRERCPDPQVARYLTMALARIEMLEKRWARHGHLRPRTHPKQVKSATMHS